MVNVMIWGCMRSAPSFPGGNRLPVRPTSACPTADHADSHSTRRSADARAPQGSTPADPLPTAGLGHSADPRRLLERPCPSREAGTVPCGGGGQPELWPSPHGRAFGPRLRRRPRLSLRGRDGAAGADSGPRPARPLTVEPGYPETPSVRVSLPLVGCPCGSDRHRPFGGPLQGTPAQICRLLVHVLTSPVPQFPRRSHSCARHPADAAVAGTGGRSSRVVPSPGAARSSRGLSAGSGPAGPPNRVTRADFVRTPRVTRQLARDRRPFVFRVGFQPSCCTEPTWPSPGGTPGGTPCPPPAADATVVPTVARQGIRNDSN